MKRIKQNIIIFGAVVVAILMVSSATAISMTQLTKMSVSTEREDGKIAEVKDEIYVDPDIGLTTADLSVLYESLQYIDNSDVYQLVEGIIDVIEDKGYVNSEDIQAIEEDLGIFFPVHAGWINSGGRGVAHCFPGEIFSALLFYIGPSIVVVWDGDDDNVRPARTAINGGILPWQSYKGDHSGIIIGFFGYVSVGIGSSGRCQYSVIGLCTLIIVDDPGDNNQNSQNNPQSTPQSNPSPSQQSTTTTTTAATTSSTISGQSSTTR